MLLGAADFSWPGIYRLLMTRHLVSESVGPPVSSYEAYRSSVCCHIPELAELPLLGAKACIHCSGLMYTRSTSLAELNPLEDGVINRGWFLFSCGTGSCPMFMVVLSLPGTAQPRTVLKQRPNSLCSRFPLFSLC